MNDSVSPFPISPIAISPIYTLPNPMSPTFFLNESMFALLCTSIIGTIILFSNVLSCVFTVKIRNFHGESLLS